MLKSILLHPIKFLKTILIIPKNKSDLSRWENIENLSENWDSRTIIIGNLIPQNSSVLEFGAGRCVLREHLPSSCSYQPSDIVDRGDNTIVCDLNQEFPILTSHYTHVVFSGVLEYIINIDKLLKELRKHSDFIIASYATTNNVSDYLIRKQGGWLNHFNDEEIISIFGANGFNLKSTYPWRYQTIYIFEQTN